MKNVILVLLTVLVLMAEPVHAGWFDNKEEQRLREVAQELQQQRQATGGWQITTGLSVVGAVVLFTVGTALGSKARRARKEGAR